MRKAHTMSDSDSDDEILAPLSKRLFSGLHSENIQSNSHPLVEKFPETQTTDKPPGCVLNASKAFTRLKSGVTAEGITERKAKLTSDSALTHNVIIPLDVSKQETG